MRYFSAFPKLRYNFNIKGEDRLIIVRDIALNLRFVNDVVNGIDFYNQYDIEDGETPEFVSERVYNTPHYHWAIMLYNGKFDYIEDWPRSSFALSEYITDKYGDGHEHDQHVIYNNPHYVDNNDNVFYRLNPITSEDISLSVYGSRVVTNTEYETILNDSKRRIKLLDPALMSQVVNEYQAAFSIINI